jgi:hypothetical protein
MPPDPFKATCLADIYAPLIQALHDLRLTEWLLITHGHPPGLNLQTLICNLRTRGISIRCRHEKPCPATGAPRRLIRPKEPLSLVPSPTAEQRPPEIWPRQNMPALTRVANQRDHGPRIPGTSRALDRLAHQIATNPTVAGIRDAHGAVEPIPQPVFIAMAELQRMGLTPRAVMDGLRRRGIPYAQRTRAALGLPRKPRPPRGPDAPKLGRPRKYPRASEPGRYPANCLVVEV